MGKAIKLIDDEQQLKDKLQKACEDYWQFLNGKGSSDGKNLSKLSNEMAKMAHELHMSLKKRKLEPKHHAFMIKNRGCQPEEDFYRHIHPIEDLLAFIDDRNANDDPIDVTLGKEFVMKIYTRRWKHEDDYHIKRTESGWDIEVLSINGECDKTGFPYLYKNLDHDEVCYPKQLGDFMERLWDKAAEKGLKEREVQKSLNQIARWINTCEKNVPEGILK